MNFTSVIPLLYLLFLLALFTFLLIRGVTHSFIACLAAGALLELIPHLGFSRCRQCRVASPLIEAITHSS